MIEAVSSGQVVWLQSVVGGVLKIKYQGSDEAWLFEAS